jgi:hypothetical protein
MLKGQSKNCVAIDGQDMHQVFLNNTLPSEEMTMHHITLQHGNAEEYGGCLLNESGRVKLDHVVIKDCFAYASAGGLRNNAEMHLYKTAILRNYAYFEGTGGLSNHGVMTITDSYIDGNTGEEGAGGILNGHDGHLLMTNVQVKNNQTTDGDYDSPWEGPGGGIINAGQLTMTGGYIMHNHGNWGGGLFNATHTWTGITATVTLHNVRIEQNTGNGAGGGILNMDGVVNITEGSTVCQNRVLYHWIHQIPMESNVEGDGTTVADADSVICLTPLQAGM